MSQSIGGILMLIFARAVLILWFASVSLMVLIPSYSILRSAAVAPASSIPPPPEAPVDLSHSGALSFADQTPASQRVELLTENATIATARATIYTQQVAAYKARLDAIARSPSVAAYETVVKGALAGLLTTFFAAVLGLAFTKGSVGVAQNLIRQRKNEPLKEINLL